MKYVFPNLTDARNIKSFPLSKKGYDRAVGVLGERDDPDVVAICRRVRTRQWGNATPAQALLFCAALPNWTSPRSAPLLTNIPIPCTKEELNDHWDQDAGTKEYNLFIQLADQRFGKCGRHDYLHAVAWLCGANQEQIQEVLKPFAEKFCDPGSGNTLQIRGELNGLRGFLKRSEVFFLGNPKVGGFVKIAPKAVDDGPSVADLLSEFDKDEKGKK